MGRGSEGKYVADSSVVSSDRLINEVLMILGRNDLKFLDDLKRRRRITGIVVSVIGIVILIGAFYYYSIAPQQGFLWIFFGWIIAFSLIREGFLMFSEANKAATPGAGRYRPFSKLICVKCNYSEVRPYRIGEVVGSKVDKVCPKCGGEMRVGAIFAEPEKRIKTVGMPILPGLGGASSSAWDRFLLVLFRIIPPLGIVYRFYRSRCDRSRK